jgi:hypothetical protein
MIHRRKWLSTIGITALVCWASSFIDGVSFLSRHSDTQPVSQVSGVLLVCLLAVVAATSKSLQGKMIRRVIVVGVTVLSVVFLLQLSSVLSFKAGLHVRMIIGSVTLDSVSANLFRRLDTIDPLTLGADATRDEASNVRWRLRSEWCSSLQPRIQNWTQFSGKWFLRFGELRSKNPESVVVLRRCASQDEQLQLVERMHDWTFYHLPGGWLALTPRKQILR